RGGFERTGGGRGCAGAADEGRVALPRARWLPRRRCVGGPCDAGAALRARSERAERRLGLDEQKAGAAGRHTAQEFLVGETVQRLVEPAGRGEGRGLAE